MLISAVATLFLLGGIASPMEAPVPFSGRFELLLVSDSVWGHCDMSVRSAEGGGGEVLNACRTYDGPVERKTRTLVLSEMTQLRGLLREADLFGTISEGSDTRGVDLPLITLRAKADGRTVEVVCFRNADFEREGPRKRLLDKLMMLFRETDDR